MLRSIDKIRLRIHSCSHDQAGFSIIEFMIGMLILAIILTVTLLTSSVFSSVSINSQRQGASTNNAQIDVAELTRLFGNAYTPSSSSDSLLGITDDCSGSPTSYTTFPSGTGPFVTGASYTSSTSVTLCAFSTASPNTTYTYQVEAGTCSTVGTSSICPLDIYEWPPNAGVSSMTLTGVVENVFKSPTSVPMFTYYSGGVLQASASAETDAIQININVVAVNIPNSPQTTVLDTIPLGSNGGY